MARLAYFLSEFPLLSTTFIQRELDLLNTAYPQFAPLLIANTAPKPGTFHARDAHYANETIYLKQQPLLRFVTANLSLFFAAPLRYVCTFFRDCLFPLAHLKNIPSFFAAPMLISVCRRHGVNHVHVHFAFGAATVAACAANLGNVSYSLTIHGSDVLLNPLFLEQKLARARAVVSNCSFHVSRLSGLYPRLPPRRFLIIPIGLDLHSPPWQAALKPSAAKPLQLLHVGRLVAVKGQHLLIEAVVRCHRKGIAVQCTIIGEGPLRDSLQQLINHHQASAYIQLVGALDQQAIAGAMEASHCVVLSSLSEGTPMTLIEAMAKARPVIAPCITAIPEVVEHERTGLLFKKGSVEELAKQIVRVAEYPEECESMGRAGRLRAEALFDLTKSIQLLGSFFATMLTQP